MSNPTALEELSKKITLVIEKFNQVYSENNELKAQLALKEEEILKLKEDSDLINMELEDINEKINRMLS
ncbi:MAG: hypothetical protein IE889_04490 [Campylobacterales bacterium]|nr:hypothetical protein [Campylobacterales bacterium]